MKYPNISIYLYDDNSKGVQQRIEFYEVDFGMLTRNLIFYLF